MDKALAAPKPVTLRDYLNMEQVKRRFAEALGGNPGQFIATIIVASIINPDIQNCEPNSVINAALQAASLSLSISPSLGQAAIIPFNSKDGKKAQFQIMKNGLVQLALRTNQYRYLQVGNVYQGETINEDRLTGKTTLGGARTGDEVIGKCAYFQLLNGFEKYLVMSIPEILEHAKKFSKSWSRKENCFYKGSAWDTSFDKMCDKTVLKLLLKNYGVLSDKMEQVLERENETGEVEHIDIPFEDVTNPEPQTQEQPVAPVQSKPVDDVRIRTQLTEDEMMEQLGYPV